MGVQYRASLVQGIEPWLRRRSITGLRPADVTRREFLRCNPCNGPLHHRVRGVESAENGVEKGRKTVRARFRIRNSANQVKLWVSPAPD